MLFFENPTVITIIVTNEANLLSHKVEYLMCYPLWCFCASCQHFICSLKDFQSEQKLKMFEPVQKLLIMTYMEMQRQTFQLTLLEPYESYYLLYENGKPLTLGMRPCLNNSAMYADIQPSQILELLSLF